MELKISSTKDFVIVEVNITLLIVIVSCTEWQAESQTYELVGRPVRDHAFGG